MVTPLPNITVYYTLYRIWSHSRALQGSSVLDKGFTALDSEQLEDLRQKLIDIQDEHGVEYPKGTWPYKLIHKDDRYLDIFDRLITLHKKRTLERRLQNMLEGSIPSAKSIVDPGTTTESDRFAPEQILGDTGSMNSKNQEVFDTGIHLVFHSDDALEQVTNPRDRLNYPLSDKMAIKIGEMYDAPHIVENVARARKRIVGSFFPSDSREW